MDIIPAQYDDLFRAQPATGPVVDDRPAALVDMMEWLNTQPVDPETVAAMAAIEACRQLEAPAQAESHRLVDPPQGRGRDTP